MDIASSVFMPYNDHITILRMENNNTHTTDCHNLLQIKNKKSYVFIHRQKG